jgi:TetR/AcrR family transcriptional regulator, cholesterol catabolism regulator
MAKASGSARPASRGNPPEASDVRTLILDTAAQLFSRDGYSAVSLRDIAGECGMKAASLYYHFTSKEEIVTEVLKTGVERVFEEVRRAVMRLPPDANARTLLNAAICAHLLALLEQHNYTSANVRIFSQVPKTVRQPLITIRDNYEAYWTSLLARCAESGGFSPDRNLQLARLFLISALNGTLEWYHPGERSVPHIAEELTSIFLGSSVDRCARGHDDQLDDRSRPA